MRVFYVLLFFSIVAFPGFSQNSPTNNGKTSKDDVESLKAKAKDLVEVQKAIEDFKTAQKDKVFRFGLSTGYRRFSNSEADRKARAIPTITPGTKIISIDYGDKVSVVVSTTVAAYPFINKRDSSKKFIKILTQIGFIANINLTEFANGKSNNVFNKQVDGGLGISIMLGKQQKFALAATIERISVRQPTTFVFQQEGKQILDDNNQPLSALDVKDERFFYNAGVNGWSLKFVYHFD